MCYNMYIYVKCIRLTICLRDNDTYYIYYRTPSTKPPQLRKHNFEKIKF